MEGGELGRDRWEFGLSRCIVYPGTEPTSLTSPALAAGFFITSATWEAPNRECVDNEVLLRSTRNCSQYLVI